MNAKGLIIRAPYVNWILDGLKTWEIRGTATKVRGPVALIEGGTRTIVGTCELRDTIGPLTLKQLQANADKLNESRSSLTRLYYDDHTYAWVLASAKRLKKPVQYKHPHGAVIWVTLAEDIVRKIGL